MGLAQSPPENFVQLVRETAQWCALRANVADPEHSLRTPELATPTPIAIWDEDQENWFARFAQQLDTLADMRRRLLIPQKPPARTNGRLITLDIMNTDSSGGTRVCSENFFDSNDCPPTDTWVCVIRPERPPSQKAQGWRDPEILIYWIPEVFYPQVEEGIRCDYMEIIGWIDEPRTRMDEFPVLESLHRQWQSAQP